MMRKALLGVFAVLCLAACERKAEISQPFEEIVVGAVRLRVDAEGEIRAAKATPLVVPGEQWTQRQPIWLMSDGEPVKAGDVIARFSTQQSELELSQIVIDLERSRLSRIAQEVALESERSHVSIDLIDVATRFAIARRYADVNLSMVFSRNEVLDAIDDERFLGARREVLEWKRDVAAPRAATESAVFEAQRQSFERNAEVRRKDLDASELHAPHAGVLMLAKDWAGERPRAGTNMMAGQVLGYLPDIGTLDVELKLPQAAGEGLRVGQKVYLHLLGRPESRSDTALSSVAATAQPYSRENPAPYITARAPLSPQAVQALGLVPGMRVQAQVELLDAPASFSVPNISLVEEKGQSFVYVQTRGEPQRKQIELGVRGAARSEVRRGLVAGDSVLLIPPRDVQIAAPAPESVSQ